MEPISNNQYCYVCRDSNGATNSAKLMICARCKCIYYCSIEHQKNDWNRHKVDCSKLAARTTSTPATLGKAVSPTILQPIAPQQYQQLMSQLERAEVLRKNQQYHESIAIFKVIAETMQEPSSANLGLGICYANLERYEEALEQVNLVLKAAPNNIDALIQRAGVFLKLGEFEKADQDKRTIIRIERDHPAVNAIELLVKSKETEIAKKGQEHFQKGEIEAAVKEFEHARKITRFAKEHTHMYPLFLGLSYSLLGCSEQALENLNQCLGKMRSVFKKEHQVIALIHRALAHCILGHLKEANCDIIQIQKLEPKNINIYFLKGILFQGRGNTEESVKFLWSFYLNSHSDGKKSAIERILNQLVDLKNQDQADQIVDKILEDSPQFHEVMAVKAQLFVQRNNAAEALRWLDRSIAICSDYYPSLAFRAALMMDLCDFQSAESDCRAALDLIEKSNPDLAKIEDLLANIKNKNQNVEAGLTFLKLALDVEHSPILPSKLPDFAQLVD